jgi:hypothetical protein
MSIDTVGRRLQLAIEARREASMWASYAVGHRMRGDKEEADNCEAKSAGRRGAAYGHAFRAAELAYDLGQAHATGARP